MLLVLLVLLVTWGAAGCSGDPAGREPSPSPVVDEGALAEGLAALYAGDHPDREDVREGDCFAEALLGSTMPAALQDSGLVGADGRVATEIPPLGDDVAGLVADAQLACTDFIADSTAAQVSVTKGRLDAEAYAACLRDALSDDDIRATVVASLQGDLGDPAVRALSDAQDGCAQVADR